MLKSTFNDIYFFLNKKLKFISDVSVFTEIFYILFQRRLCSGFCINVFLPFSLQLNLDHAMPNGYEMFSAIAVMKVLTLVLTNSLGSYESSYLNAMDNEGRSFVRKLVPFLNQILFKNHEQKKFLYLQLY